MPTGHYRFRRSLGNVGSLFRGARPDTYPLFSGLLDQYVGAAAAYSLRALAASWLRKDVVEVRRASDNTSKGFTEKEITDGAMVDWVNETVELPLDTASAAAAYSLRNLSTSYTGNVVDVRRSSDNALEAFTAAEVADGTLTDWVGAGNDGFVPGWYDQSGNGNHAIQTDAASQPKIVDAGVLVSGGIDFDGADDYLDASGVAASLSGTDKPLSSFTVVSSDVAATTQFVLSCGRASTSTPIKNTLFHSGNNLGFQVRDDANVLKSNLISSPYSPSTTYLVSNTSDGLILDFAKNGLVTSNDFDVDVDALTIDTVKIGARANSSSGPLNGRVQEIIIYNSDQSDNRTAIESNIASHYSITLPTGSNPGSVDGFVSTWYDQSGNANNAVQATSTSQPKIVDAGVLVANGINFDRVDDGFDIDFGADLTQANSLFMVHQSHTLTDSSNEFFDSSGSASPRTLLDQSSADYRLLSGTSAGTGVALTTDQSLVSAIYNGSSSLFAKN